MASSIWFHWNMSSDEILEEAQNLINKSISNNRRLIKLNLVDAENRISFLSMLSDDMTEFTTYHTMCSFLQYVTPDRKIKVACSQADLLLSNYINSLNSDPLIYLKLVEFKKHTKEAELEDEDIQFIDRLILEYERNGAKLNKANRALLNKIIQEIEKIEKSLLAFVDNVQQKKVELTEEEMTGVPNIIKTQYPVVRKGPIHYGVQLNHRNYLQLMRYILNEDVRKKLEQIYMSSFTEMTDEIARLLVLRSKKALILGYDSYSDYKLSTMMAKNPKNVKEFLMTLFDKLENRYIQETKMLKNLKKIDVKRGQAKNFEKLNSWDVSFYLTRWKKKYGLQEDYIREFFPLPHVLKMILRIYGDIFQIKFARIKDKLIWHPDVATYAIYDAKKGSLLGYCYLDLYYREGKYSDIRCFGLQLPCMYPLNLKKHQTPMVALIAPFKNNLLLHSEMVSLFHEFTHVLHFIFGRTKYSLFSGTNVELDFVETPAQVMEAIAWNPVIIKKLSSHYKTKEPLPDQVIQKMTKIRDLNIGIHYRKNILLSIFDQLVHSSSSLISLCEKILTDEQSNEQFKKTRLADAMTNLYQELHCKIMEGICMNKGHIFPIEWIAMLVGNDSKYYSSIWSKIYSTEILNKRELGGLVDPQLGSDLYHKLMKHGGSKSSVEYLHDLLGTTPSIEGFFDYYNLESDVEHSYFFSTERFKTENIEMETETETERMNYFTEQDKSDTDVGMLYIKEKLNNHYDDYVPETSENLSRYSNIFIKR